MAVVPFGSYRPDMSDLNSGVTGYLANVIPRADGYGPFNSLLSLSQALPKSCKGYFFARTADGSLSIFAATDSRIYMLDNSTYAWVDVSKGGAEYSSIDHDRIWKFAQFNNFVIAVQRNAPPQIFDMVSGGAFADLGGAPPQAGHVSIVGSFVVLCDIPAHPYRLQWSGLNDPSQWTPGVNYSDYQDLPTGGIPKMVLGGELGIILQDTEIRRMIYAAGSDVVFQIDKVAESTGIVSSAAAAAADNRVFACSTKGFVSIGVDGSVGQIGFEQVDRTFFTALYDDTHPECLMAAADPQAGIIVWAYRSPQAPVDHAGFDHLITYNYNLKRWSPPISILGDAVASMSWPGLTLETIGATLPGAATISGAANNGAGLVRLTVSSTVGWSSGNYKTIYGVAGTVEANGTFEIVIVDATHIDLVGTTFANTYVSGGVVSGSIDDATISFDSYPTSTLSKMSMCGADHRIGFFNGPSIEAVIGIPESHLDLGYRVNINGMIPVTDAASVYGMVLSRDRRSSSLSASAEQAMDSDGFIPALVNSRLARGVIRIPAGESWTFATGIEPIFTRAGRY